MSELPACSIIKGAAGGKRKSFVLFRKIFQRLLETLPDYEGPFKSVEGSKSPKDNFSLEV